MELFHRNTTRSVLAGLAALILVFGAAGCGDDDDTSATTSTTAATETTASEAASAEPTIADAWVRPVEDLAATTRTAIYMEITGGTEDDALVAASVPAEVAATVEIHETVAADGEATPDTGGHMGDDTTTTMGDDDDAAGMDDGGMDDGAMGEGEGDGEMGGGMMTMQPVDRIEIPAGGTVALQPGGYHVMLLDVQAELVPGDTVEVTLTFEQAGEVVVTAEVREP